MGTKILKEKQSHHSGKLANCKNLDTGKLNNG